MSAPTPKQRRAAKQRDAHAWKRNAGRFHTCPECEANFRLTNEQFPPHAFLGKPCPGGSCSPCGNPADCYSGGAHCLEAKP
jgi:hypothetical protein